MFTGIVEGLGAIREIQPAGLGKRLTVEAQFDLDRTKVGDSISVSGACLTVVEIAGKKFKADVAPETLGKTTLGRAKIGERVNLERALRLSDRLDGHLVSGHIDGMGVIAHKKTVGNAVIVTVGVSELLVRYIIIKGSVAVDGISLTVNDCARDRFEVSIIPHTAKLTTIGFKHIGDRVNIETDMIGKYVERFVIKNEYDSKTGKTTDSTIDKLFSAKTGFL